MKKWTVLSSACLSILSGTLSAGTMGSSHAPYSGWNRVVALSVGPVWTQAGNTQSFYLTPEIAKTYVANQSTHALADGELFIGAQKNASPSIQTQLGLAIAATSDAPLSGLIWDDELPQFANYRYQYKIQHSHVAIKGKVLIRYSAINS